MKLGRPRPKATLQAPSTAQAQEDSGRAVDCDGFAYECMLVMFRCS
jgi:hypothetical protein